MTLSVIHLTAVLFVEALDLGAVVTIWRRKRNCARAAGQIDPEIPRSCQHRESHFRLTFIDLGQTDDTFDPRRDDRLPGTDQRRIELTEVAPKVQRVACANLKADSNHVISL
jgi:hypothetical protein